MSSLCQASFGSSPGPSLSCAALLPDFQDIPGSSSEFGCIRVRWEGRLGLSDRDLHVIQPATSIFESKPRSMLSSSTVTSTGR